VFLAHFPFLRKQSRLMRLLYWLFIWVCVCVCSPT
jgi:hypothetical protein